MHEFVIKVPAPFSGIDDLGFSARYPEQDPSEPLRDIPVIIEGPRVPMHVLVKRLTLFTQKDRLITSGAEDDAYMWTAPVQLTDEVCVMAFKDRSLSSTAALPREVDEVNAVTRGYFWNLVRPLAFTFLRDCVRIGGLRLADRISIVLDTGTPPMIDLEMQRSSISPVNGSLELNRSRG
jgi:hypothetical protein